MTIVDYAPSFPAPHSDLKAVLRVADFSCSCVVSYPEYPSFRAHVRLVLAAGRHLRVYQSIVAHEGLRCNHRNPQPSAMGIFIIRKDGNSLALLKGRFTPIFTLPSRLRIVTSNLGSTFEEALRCLADTSRDPRADAITLSHSSCAQCPEWRCSCATQF